MAATSTSKRCRAAARDLGEGTMTRWTRPRSRVRSTGGETAGNVARRAESSDARRARVPRATTWRWARSRLGRSGGRGSRARPSLAPRSRGAAHRGGVARRLSIAPGRVGPRGARTCSDIDQRVQSIRLGAQAGYAPSNRMPGDGASRLQRSRPRRVLALEHSVGGTRHSIDLQVALADYASSTSSACLQGESSNSGPTSSPTGRERDLRPFARRS